MNYRRLFIPKSIVFITFVTYKRQEFLISNIDLLKKSIREAMQNYKFEIIAICVLKNHVHILLKPNKIGDYPNIIKNIKRNFSIEFDTNQIINYSVTESRKNKNEKGIWQRRYWEHTIINEKDLYKHIDYIHFNPMKHYGIKPKDWTFSSFKKFVNDGYYEIDWCNIDDKYCINSLDFE